MLVPAVICIYQSIVAAHLYVFYLYRNRSDDRTLVRSCARSVRSEPTLAAFASFLFFYYTIECNKYIYTKNTITILRQQRGVQELGRVSICPTISINSLVRICETPSSRVIQIRNTKFCDPLQAAP